MVNPAKPLAEQIAARRRHRERTKARRAEQKRLKVLAKEGQ